MFKVAYYKHKEIAKEKAKDPNNIDELLEFHNRIVKENNITYSNSKHLEFYTQLSETA